VPDVINEVGEFTLQWPTAKTALSLCHCCLGLILKRANKESQKNFIELATSQQMAIIDDIAFLKSLFIC